MSVEVVLPVLAMLSSVVVLQALPSRAPRGGPILDGKEVLRGRGAGEGEGEYLTEGLGEPARRDTEGLKAASLA